MNNQSEKLINHRLARELDLDFRHVSEAISLLDGGDTIPFIARYRKELTGGMSDEQLRVFVDRLALYRNLERRRADIWRLLQSQDMLTPELEHAVQEASSVTELEDLYRPYRPRKRTRAMIAREKGLEPLAQAIFGGRIDPAKEALNYLDAGKGVLEATDALQGASDIIAEVVADDPKPRRWLRDFLLNKGMITARKRGRGSSTYEMYDDYREPCKSVSPHRILAMNRGEKEGHLLVKIEVSEERALSFLQSQYIQGSFLGKAKPYLEKATKDSWKRLLFPSLEREIRAVLTQKAEKQALRVFKENLRSLLMTPPVQGRRILAIDPGLRTGCKIACVDENGKLLETALIFPTPPRSEIEKAGEIVCSLVKKHYLNAIVIGNGTGGRETEIFIAELLEACPGELSYTIVDEAGASVYSASPLGQAEFPGLDPSVRGAVSLARRLQDALSELVKI
ncbi:MAG: Tex-like N-terminal domain-containing protein, partial [Dethiobacteria bacterium]